jgi:hypothetical protein
VKLRLHAGSLRLRLSQSEVACFKRTGKVEDSIEFAPEGRLSYALESGATPEIAASFVKGTIRVVVPKSIATRWADSDEIGMDASSGPLRILIEKDFQCLHREPEPGEDSFPNPQASS